MCAEIVGIERERGLVEILQKIYLAVQGSFYASKDRTKSNMIREK